MTSGKSEKFTIEQGRCYLVDMNPPRKSKPGKVRPVVVIQTSDTLKSGSPGAVIVPLTTQLQEENILRTRLKISPNLSIQKHSDVLIDQIHTVDRAFFIEDLGFLEPSDFKKIQRGVSFLLGLKE